MKNKKKDFFSNNTIALVPIILLFLLKLPVLNAPLFEDPAWVNFYHVRDMAMNNFKPILGEGYDYNTTGHPPFYFWIWTLIYKIFGYNLYAFHIMALFFAFLTLYFTYLLGKHLYNKKVGFYSSLVLLFLPLFFVSSGRLELTLPLSALTVAGLYFFLKQKKYSYLLTASCLILTKEQGVFAILSILMYILLKHFKKSKAIHSVHAQKPRIFDKSKVKLLKELFFYSIPLFIFGIWSAYKYSITNSIFFEGTGIKDSIVSQITNITVIEYITNFYRLNKILFFDQFVFLLSIPLVYCIYRYLSKKNIMKKFELKLAIPLLIIIFYVFSFSVLHWFQLDDLLPVYPILIIFSIKSICSIFKNKSKYMILVIILLFVWQWSIPSSTWTLMPSEYTTYDKEFSWRDMLYLNYFKVQKEAFSYINDHYPNSVILSDFDKTEKMIFPMFGYVKKPMNCLNPKKYFHYKAPYKDIKEINPNSFQFLILGKGWDLEWGLENITLFKELIKKYNLSIVKKFSYETKSENITMEIYSKDVN